jgi:hypothetical protein
MHWGGHRGAPWSVSLVYPGGRLLPPTPRPLYRLRGAGSEERRHAIARAVDKDGRTRDLLARHDIECPTVTGAGTGTGSFEFEAASGVYTGSDQDPNQSCARPVWGRLTIWVPEEQAALPWSALPSSWRSGRSRCAHSASLAGYPGDQVINSGEEHSQNRGCVRLVISDHQIDGRYFAF